MPNKNLIWREETILHTSYANKNYSPYFKTQAMIKIKFIINTA